MQLLIVKKIIRWNGDEVCMKHGNNFEEYMVHVLITKISKLAGDTP